MKQLFATVFFTTFIAVGTAWAHGDSHKTGKKPVAAFEEKLFGKPGDARKITRTIRVDMDDTMHFNPENVSLKPGDTVKFIARNKGKIMHEMVLGTMKELKEHHELMKKFPDMEHDEPYMVHVPPGKSEELVWQFTKSGEFFFACLIPGHLEAGMIGKITVGKP